MGFTACGDGCDEPEPAKGKVKFVFDHRIDGDPIRFDTMIYVNEAGNPYLVNEIQYFVSDFKLWSGGEPIILDQWEDIHYVDTDLPETWNYFPADDVPLADYDSISFIFGITEEKNQSFMFVNPPESYMFWPEYLGGGYHYLKLNGKWKTPGDTVRPFNFHLGIGQIYDEQGNIVGFVQNYFTVHLSHTAFKLTAEKAAMIQITMNVEQWFKDPHTWDFNYWGGDIMENQAAMQTAKENGHNVFTAKVLLEE
jgi:hypothetical protein